MDTDHSQRKIAMIACVSKPVVNRIKIKLDQNLPLKAQQVGQSGRKCIKTPRTECQIRNICLPNRKMNAERLTLLINNDGIVILKRIVQRRLNEKNPTHCKTMFDTIYDEKASEIGSSASILDC